MFGTTAKDNYDGLSIPSLEPEKYENVRLVEVVCEKLKKADGTEGKGAIKFTFQTPEGTQHQHTEYELIPGEKDFDSKWKNQDKRIGHIMSKFVDKSLLNQNAATWMDYGKWVVATLGTVNYKEVPVDILVTGSVWQGKSKSEFTGYPPFIAKHGDKLQFDSNALASNKAYYAFKDKQSNSTPDTENTAGTANGNFNTTEGPKADF